MPLGVHKGLVCSPGTEEEAPLRRGRMPALNKEMGLQDAHMLLSINDKHSPQKEPDCAGFHVEYLQRMPDINKMTSNVSTCRFTE